MSSLVLDLGLPLGNGLLQGRKQIKGSAMAKDRERPCLRLQRMMIGRRVGTLIAFFISVLSLLMLLNVTRVTTPKPTPDEDSPPDTVFNKPHRNSSSSPLLQERVKRSQQPTFPMQRIDSYQHVPMYSSDHPLPLGHPCQGFTLPPPPADKKRTGPRPCPVCYLPVNKAVEAMPVPSAMESPISQLSYVKESSELGPAERLKGTNFGGHPSLEDRIKSYQIQQDMKIYCGFAQGVKPGVRSGFDIKEADRVEMERCTGIVVASAIFGNYDQLQQPINVSNESIKSVCFFMFIDEETQQYINAHGIEHGIWRVIVVHNLPYWDARRNGKIPKLLLHRLFPNAKFSLWIDGKLKLIVDPYQILERFLWRRNLTFAISRHYKRFDVFEEAEANKAAGKYDNVSINAQVEFYQSEGLIPYNRTTSLFPSDVPEGCVILREHTPVTNLFTCLWFNEVDRFTSRDQLSFAAVRNKLIGRVPFRLSMFLDCERRNFVVQEYHRDILEQRKSTSTILSGSQASKLVVTVPSSGALGVGSTHITSKRRKRTSNRRKMGSKSSVKAI